MATTKIETVRDVARSFYYIINPLKTNNYELVSTLHCSRETALKEFDLTNKVGDQLHKTRKDGQSAIMIYQSFAPSDDLSPQEALELGLELASEFTENQHEVVVATHVDKNHIHNHILINLRNNVDYKKMRIQKNTHLKIREISDRLCVENGLSIILDPQNKTKQYNDYQNIISSSFRDELKSLIDLVLPQMDSFTQFVETLQLNGYHIKKGKHLSVKGPGQKRFIRLKSLGPLYDPSFILKKLSIKHPVDSKAILVHINKKMIHEEGYDFIQSRIPFTKDVLTIPLSDTKWISKDTIEAKLYANVAYPVNDEAVLGKDFVGSYRQVEQKQFTPSTLTKISRLNQIDPDTFHLRRHSKKEWLTSINHLQNLFNVATKEKISIANQVTFESKILDVKKEMTHIRHEISETKEKLKFSSIAFRMMVQLQLKEEAVTQVSDSLIFNKAQKEIKLLRHHLKQLGIDTTQSFDSMKKEIQGMSQHQEKLKENLESLKLKETNLNVSLKQLQSVNKSRGVIVQRKKQQLSLHTLQKREKHRKKKLKL